MAACYRLRCAILSLRAADREVPVYEDLIQRLRDAGANRVVVGHTKRSLCDEAADALEAMQADARRYRWLRTFQVDSYLATGSLEALDADIDAAMTHPEGSAQR